MATKNFMDLTNLTQYDGLIKTYINSADAKSIKSIDIDENTVNFYKTDDASGDPAYSVDLADTSGLMPLIENATGDSVVISNSDGTVSESNISASSLVTGYFQSPHDGELIIYYDGDQTVTHSTMTVGDIENLASGVDDLESLIGEIPQSSSATTVIGYTDEQVAAIEAKLGGVLHYKGVVATVSALPVNVENGDVYHVTDRSAEYAYLVNSGTGAWEELGTVVDLSAYSTTAQMNTAISGAINALDATVSQSAGTDGLALSITETDGVLTAVSGSIAANTYLKPADVGSISQSDITALFS